MMLFYKLRPLLRSAQVEKELASLHEDFSKLKEAYDRCENRITTAASHKWHFESDCCCFLVLVVLN